jgi:hypothetical protein
MELAVLCLSTHEVFIHILGDNGILHDCVTWPSFFAKNNITANILLDWLQLFVSPQIDDMEGGGWGQNFVSTRQPHFSCEACNVRCCQHSFQVHWHMQAPSPG